MPISTTPGDRLYAQYRNKPKAVLWQNILQTLVDDNLTVALSDLSASYDIDANAGEQLNIIGRVVVQTRVVKFPVPLTGIVECGDLDDEFGDLDAEFSALTFTSSVTLTDDEYKGMLKSKIQRNNKSVTIDEIMTAVNTVLSSAQVVSLNDNGDMTFDLDIIGVLTATEISLLESANFVPRPQCVMYAGYNIINTITGSVAATLGDMTSASTGAVAEPGNVGTIAVTLDDMSSAAEGNAGPIPFWEQQLSYTGVNPQLIAVNSYNDDVIISDLPSGGEVDFYKLPGGVGPFTAMPTLVRGGSLHYAIAVDESSGARAGDIWSVHANTTELDHLPNGVGTWGTLLTYPGTNLAGIAINSTTGDLWVADSAEDGVYHYDLSTTTWSALFPILSTGGIDAIDVDDTTGDVYIATSGGLSDHQIEILTGGVGVFTVHAVDNSWEVITDIAVDTDTKDIWVVDNLFVGTGGVVYKQTAGVGSFVAQGVSRSWISPVGVSHNESDNTTWVTDPFEPVNGQIYRHA